MQFLKSKESFTFDPLTNSSPKQSNPPSNRSLPQYQSPPPTFTTLQYYSRFIKLSKVYCMSLLIQIFLNILYYELDYRGDYRVASLVDKMLLACALFSLLANFLCFFSHNDWRVAEGKSEKKVGLPCLVITQLMVLVQPYQWLEDIYIQNWNYRDRTYIPYKLNYLLTSMSLLKFILIIYSVNYHFKFNHSRSSMIWNKRRPQHPYLFSLKCLFKQHPIALVSSLFLFSIFFFTLAYRMSQRSTYIVPNSFQYYGNCIWMVFITMTTVGYGDFTPITAIGRTYGFFCTFYGVFIVSITVLVVINTFQMDSAEGETLRILKRLSQKRNIRKLAGQYIRVSLWRLWKNKKLRRRGLSELASPQNRQQKVKKNTLKEAVRVLRFNDPSQKNLSVEMTREFERVSFYLHNINHNFDAIMRYFTEENVLNVSKIGNEYEYILNNFKIS